MKRQEEEETETETPSPVIRSRKEGIRIYRRKYRQAQTVNRDTVTDGREEEEKKMQQIAF